MSQIKMLKPSDGLQGVKDFILKVVEDAGPNPCPPIVVGVGIGGTFDKAALLAKKALMRNTNVRNADPFYADLEEEMLQKINALGIGPQGVGGKTTALAVNIEKIADPHRRPADCGQHQLPCHPSQDGGAVKEEEKVMEKRITTPLTLEQVKDLKCGDSVLISGVIYTARDAAHKRLCELVAQGKELPFDPKDSVIYYVGPAPAKGNQVIGSAGPTTSYRMDAYLPDPDRAGPARHDRQGQKKP